jgi:hypothetical protein
MQSAYERQSEFFTNPFAFLGDTLANYVLLGLVIGGVYVAVFIYQAATRKTNADRNE